MTATLVTIGAILVIAVTVCVIAYQDDDTRRGG